MEDGATDGAQLGIEDPFEERRTKNGQLCQYYNLHLLVYTLLESTTKILTPWNQSIHGLQLISIVVDSCVLR